MGAPDKTSKGAVLHVLILVLQRVYKRRCSWQRLCAYTGGMLQCSTLALLVLLVLMKVCAGNGWTATLPRNVPPYAAPVAAYAAAAVAGLT